ncbi:hypothetical protein D3C76_1855480 [compost metagenome]
MHLAFKPFGKTVPDTDIRAVAVGGHRGGIVLRFITPGVETGDDVGALAPGVAPC